MAAYEVMYIVNPNLEEENVNAVVERFNNLIADQGGKVEEVDLWGKRRLAYEINKFKEGYYVVVNFQGDAKVVNELQRVMKISDDVIRFLLLSKEDK
ncbi:MAG TPA: 30S ribosomal protein S6 [Clostridia bacterium]|nr:30S ribosomal protein S6 [Clostridia bacterium]